jgi:UDP:flavonoid glycosyltransferase YjiC (YdhE family)
MRVLFTFAGGSGHADPLVPIAGAAGAAEHAVAFTGVRASVLARLRARGFTTFAPPGETLPAPAPGAITPLVALDTEREERVLREQFAGSFARERAAHVLALCAEWSPDVVVCDQTDFGGAIAAERHGLAYATVEIGAAGSFLRAEVVAGALDVLRAEHGLAPDPGFERPSRHLVLSPFPPSLRDPAYRLPPSGHAIRPVMLAPVGEESAPDWLARLPSAPTVYFTLGTVFNMESGDLFARVLAGLRDLPVNVIVTVGGEIDPGTFGPQPANVHIERYIPQSAVLPHCDVVVSHGGSGSVVAALAAGLPSVVIPMGADQPANAARCEAIGAGLTLDALRATPHDVREAVGAVLDDPAYRVAAERVRDEIAALPGPEEAVRLLERLAGDRPPALGRTS